MLVGHGSPVVITRQWNTGLAPSADGTKWNFIALVGTGEVDPYQAIVVKDLTGSPSVSVYDGPSGIYANSLGAFGYLSNLRAANGRIFWPMFRNYTAVYDPATESVSIIGPFVENPAIYPAASTIPYSACFDTAGVLYFATQESQKRPSCVVSTDPEALTQSVLGYVGTDAATYTTYGYRIVADTGVTGKRYVYVVYGEDPWQLWALNTDTGAGTKLTDAASTGAITFAEVSGQGWVATVQTDLGKPDNVSTKYWCQDGALSHYSDGVPSPSPRDVHPLTGSLTSPPSLDITRGAGQVGWRANGSSGEYTYVDYPLAYTAPDAIECLVATPSGVCGSSASYDGMFAYNQSTNLLTWYGAEGLVDFAQPLALRIDDVSYFAGYPNGGLYAYSPAADYNAYPTVVNPALIGYYGYQGTQYAGIKYAGDPSTPTTYGALGNLLWVSGAGSSGRLYCAGWRERNGSGAGIGYWDKSTNSFAGTYGSPLDVVYPEGLVSLDAPGYVLMSSRLISGSGDAPLFVYDHNLTLIAQHTPVTGLANLGRIVPTSNPAVVCGIYQNASGYLALWQYSSQTGTLVQSVVTSVSGTLGCGTLRTGDGSYWCVVGTNLVRIDPSAMTATASQDLSSIAPVSAMSFGGDGSTLYLAGGSDRSYSQIWSIDLPIVLTYASGPPAHGTIRAVSGRGGLRTNQGRATIRKLS